MRSLLELKQTLEEAYEERKRIDEEGNTEELSNQDFYIEDIKTEVVQTVFSISPNALRELDRYIQIRNLEAKIDMLKREIEELDEQEDPNRLKGMLNLSKVLLKAYDELYDLTKNDI